MAKSDVYTNDPYRPTASNHINKVAYVEQDRILYIQFSNGAYYEYLNVPKSLYIGMMQAPSHGTYFWAHIRQVYDYNKLSRPPLLMRQKSVQEEICPEQTKLNKLDEQEARLNRSFRQCEITADQYARLSNVISNKRDVLIKRLIKIGYFEETELPTIEDNEEYYQEGPYFSFWDVLCKGGMLVTVIGTYLFKTLAVCLGVVIGILAACK